MSQIIELDAWIGTWEGSYLQRPALSLRLFDADDQLILIEGEAERQQTQIERQQATAAQQQAEAAQQQAEAERQRAEAAEAELTRLRSLLDERNSGV